MRSLRGESLACTDLTAGVCCITTVHTAHGCKNRHMRQTVHMCTCVHDYTHACSIYTLSPHSRKLLSVSDIHTQAHTARTPNTIFVCCVYDIHRRRPFRCCRFRCVREYSYRDNNERERAQLVRVHARVRANDDYFIFIPTNRAHTRMRDQLTNQPTNKPLSVAMRTKRRRHICQSAHRANKSQRRRRRCGR